MIDPRPAPRARPADAARAATLALALLGALAIGGRSAHGAERGAPRQAADPSPTARLFLPLTLRDGPGGRGFPAVPTAADTPGPSPTPRPSATATEPPPPTPTPAPTRDPRRVSYPTAADAIVLQVGQSDTEQDGPAWEEMNGTPYLTVYGDGRVLAGRRLLAPIETLHEVRVDDETIQSWLVPITYDAQLFTLGERYVHPTTDHFAAHVYVRFGPDASQSKRVTIGGLRNWLDGPLPDDPDAARVRLLAERLAALDDFTAGLDAPWAPSSYTVIAHEVNGTGAAPRWPLALDIRAISDSAPLRPVDGHPHGPPGHRVVDAAVGGPARATTLADAKRDFPGFNYAARYLVGGRYFIVGARPEVPGGSVFLPDRLHDQWYRKDG